MILAILFGVALSGLPEGVARFGISGAIEELSRPADADLWRDLQADASWSGSPWGVAASARTVRRWGMDDAEFRLGAHRLWLRCLKTQLETSVGVRDRFLPSWMLHPGIESNCPGGWVAGMGWKIADYDGFDVHQPELKLERYWNSWRTGMVVGFPWSDGLFPALSARVLAGWDWSDAGGVSVDLGSSREMESTTTGIADRRALSVAGGVRQGVGALVTVRASATWTRLERIHDRLEGRLGLDFRVGD